mgnify:CR=1 FL=1
MKSSYRMRFDRENSRNPKDEERIYWLDRENGRNVLHRVKVVRQKRDKCFVDGRLLTSGRGDDTEYTFQYNVF